MLSHFVTIAAPSIDNDTVGLSYVRDRGCLRDLRQCGCGMGLESRVVWKLVLLRGWLGLLSRGLLVCAYAS